jgi:hypothetical protein
LSAALSSHDASTANALAARDHERLFYTLRQVARLLVVLGLAVGYYLLRNNVHLTLVDAVIFSISSFHGEACTLGNWSHCTTR